MFQENIFKILFLTVALAQLSFAYKECRFPINYVQKQSNEKDKDLPATLQLTKFIVDHGSNFYFKVNEKHKTVINSVLKELETSNDTEYQVQHLKDAIKAYDAKYPFCQGFPKLQNLKLMFNVILDQCRSDIRLKKDERVKLIVEVLDKYEDTVDNIFKEAEEFVNNFEQKFDELKKIIEQENKMLSVELDKWYKENYDISSDPRVKAESLVELPFEEFFLEATCPTRAALLKY
ncbi:hypothetical protein DOY81_000497 [Sarcophaga bullata]|nr:hypothetical protein DOY81_000497 [Sarcophaga bullata]